MNPKLKMKPERLQESILEKKKVNFTTLKTIIEHTCSDREITNNMLLAFENHIRARNERRIHNRCHFDFPKIVLKFENYYSKKYAKTSLTHHTYHVGKFLGYLLRSFPSLSPLQSIQDCKKITSAMVTNYEEYLVNRIYLEQIQKSSVNRMLYSMKLFLNMLSDIKVNHIRYIIPQSLRAQAKRSNNYVNLGEVLILLESIGKCRSKLNHRNICIFLLIMELGCRPIEVASIRLDDIRFTERLITLRSVKSRTRTLKMSKDLTNMLQEYLSVYRPMYPTNNNDFFIKSSGDPISSSTISSLFGVKIKQVFGELRFSAKALRHTYATNALDNSNDFDQVSESMGHKHRRSTEWYIYRSVQRMLTRSLPHNPLNQLDEV
ncbi:integrase [Paenibacillus anaericanus]|uniref:tyrosine-type recombinase/integrase n=1 Tax=Paenibacillus anaericanus TaxID=170367 RepID=UPI00278472B3|nr:site-specific integrase [Paenibacillus anaericanus]MDQ0090120.1 integrase [Paenibacillus anaericanus]